MNYDDTTSTTNEAEDENSADKRHPPVPAETESVVSDVIEAAFRVHRSLGPGLLECVCHELSNMGLPLRRQVKVPVECGGFRLATDLRLDLLVADRVVLELKACDGITDLHRAQLLTYLKLTRKRVGLLLNFNTAKLKDGILRMVL